VSISPGFVNSAVSHFLEVLVVDTPMHRNTPKEVMEGLSPMGRPSTVQDIAEAVLDLTDAATVTGHVLYVDGGAHFGRW
jgi:NAD(P)-dependent dehydrogenase (short-subunit alcohol dehydrogenase family)